MLEILLQNNVVSPRTWQAENTVTSLCFTKGVSRLTADVVTSRYTIIVMQGKDPDFLEKNISFLSSREK